MAAVIEAVQDLAERYPWHRYVVTCRPYAYVGQPWKLAGFYEVTLAPFNEEQVGAFIQAWYKQMAAQRRLSEREAHERTRRLQDAVGRADAFYLPNEELLGFVEVPAGRFVMGSNEYSDEKPVHPVHLPTFYMARYPVTNAQFAAFVDAKGYSERRYWVKAEVAGVWQEGKVEGHFDEEPRDRPADYGEPYNLSNHPVVGITWYEALAYSRWLTERLREWLGMSGPLARLLREREGIVTLPSEAEWEKAARGTGGRRYPWGEEIDLERANYDQTGIGVTSAVGCFPSGASPRGLEDLSGNVWEWTRSRYQDYPYDPTDGREDLAGGASRVLRGGAFSNKSPYVRGALRYSSEAGGHTGIDGVRLAAVSFSLGAAQLR